ncbi:hypothetical protein NDI37_18440 [Funiculus sociatus GB2-A5]|uniref:Uncharacterized protein n=1 Tax=Funiculus sociatus GB2-A5 TaxID=2933946 RepID=A0ABV0JSK2_9CYAN|nr:MULTISPECIES: hypothetical protein [unclassified Trichocoleus]MBD1904822.1 hypothetical protein [Trichocoleus sp. FACHB-832]MBD1933448.1 hypothetical protein [Trichocoleus sp. FACHB-69]MBD2006725.1 hypothetical protein [Trichocoleus sp. FACHB-40]MBD2063644.1 hypothetical protein [Trichocoleus sp. FACHB-6]
MDIDQGIKLEKKVMIEKSLLEIYRFIEELEQQAKANQQRFKEAIQAAEILTTESQSSGLK